MKFEKITYMLLGMVLFLFVDKMALASDSEPVGKLMFTIGKVVIVKQDGKQHRVRRGAKIFVGDLIKTNKKGQAQIKFKDGARISVRPNSEFKVEAYAYNENVDKSDYKSELSLLKGGIRSITGAIGKSNKKSYKMKTVIATIGIRGTDYSLMLCNQDCGSKSGGKVSNGLYVGVVNGGVTVQNDAGSMDVSPNQYAMVGSATSIPKRLPKAPSFLMFDKTAASKTERTKVAKAFTNRNNAAKKSAAGNQSKVNVGQQTTLSNSRGGQSQQRAQSQSSSRQTSNSDQNTNLNETGSANTISSTSATESNSSQSSASTIPESSMVSIIDNRYSETSDVSIPIDVVDVSPELVISDVNFTEEAVDSQVAENIEPDEEVLSTEETSSSTDVEVAVGVGDEVIASNDETTASTDEIIDDTTLSSDENTTIPVDEEVNTAGSTALPSNGITRFFNFIFGTSAAQTEMEISQTETNKVTNIYEVDSSDADRTTYVEYSLDTAKLNDFGYDPDTGLSWGRWSSGNINQTIGTPDGVITNSIDLTNQSLHWIMGAEGTDTVLLPITGTRNFVLIGNTNPTDNLGNVGILGSASLTADFDAQTVDAGVNLSINQQVWEGNQQNIPLDMNSGSFYTDQLNVNVTGGTNTAGTMAGGLVDGNTNGAGLNYHMEATVDGVDSQVTGAAAFKEVP